jgi:hypothetical protein
MVGEKVVDIGIGSGGEAAIRFKDLGIRKNKKNP